MNEQERDSDHDILIRLDERTKSMSLAMSQFVTKKEFAPVRLIVYSGVGLLLLTIFGAMASAVVKH